MDSADKSRSTRFTVNNEKSSVVISQSLLEKLNETPGTQSPPQQKTEQQQQQQPQTPSTSSASSPQAGPPKNADEESSSKYADSASSADPLPPVLPPGPSTANNDKVNKDDAFCGSTSSDKNSGGVALLQEAYEAKLKQQEAEWRQRVNALEDFTDRLMKQKGAKLAEEVGQLQVQHFPRKLAATAYTEPPCKLAECTVKDCFAQNGTKQPLLCAKAVKEFVDCVRLAAFDYIEGNFSQRH